MIQENPVSDLILIEDVTAALDEADKAAMEDEKRYTHEEVFLKLRRNKFETKR